MRVLEGLGLALTLTGCTLELPPRMCGVDADCLQAGVTGQCVQSPTSDSEWCIFPTVSSECTSGWAWGLLSGDGLTETCYMPPDAGVPEADGSVDGGATDASLADASPPCVWSAPLLVLNINSMTYDAMATESHDGLALFFVRVISFEDNDIYMATRSTTTSPFMSPSVVSGFDTPFVYEDAPKSPGQGWSFSTAAPSPKTQCRGSGLPRAAHP